METKTPFLAPAAVRRTKITFDGKTFLTKITVLTKRTFDEIF